MPHLVQFVKSKSLIWNGKNICVRTYIYVIFIKVASENSKLEKQKKLFSG